LPLIANRFSQKRYDYSDDKPIRMGEFIGGKWHEQTDAAKIK